MDYLTGHSGFTLRRGEHLRNGFKRLAKAEGWSDAQRAEERKQFHRAVVQDLNQQYSKLDHYQELCQKLFDETPATVTQCKKLLTTKYVNIWDIVEEKYRYFDDFKTFRNYTKKGRLFDRQEAKALLLNVFLERMF
ncbi:hypothetical protein EMPS_06595 [Entomortierella parvispora]|uniref:Uncharacterized protein n=1 Tax=Entomortierella parvispora TaxID=205924 RepID=A0A9P3HD96_9FUNG|nr:hypothetical protein EMPS_06595 [Entomortierella parvispora]